MKISKKIAFVVAVFLLVIGFNVHTAQAQSTESCINLTQNMKYRSTDATTNGEVSILQGYLNRQGYLVSSPTGFFGKATRKALMEFQHDNNFYPRASDYGSVGSMTRKLIKKKTCPEGTQSGSNNQGQATGTPFTIILPSGSRNEVFAPGGNITVELGNPVYATVAQGSIPARNALTYNVDLIKDDSYVQSLGSMSFATQTASYKKTFTLSTYLQKSSKYRVKVTPSCNSYTDLSCRPVWSSYFMVSDNPNDRDDAKVKVVSPSEGTYVQGGSLTLKINTPSDKPYSLSYYLVPQAGTPIKPAGNGSYFDQISGGYNIGAVAPSTATSQFNSTVTIPSDIPAGRYKLRVYLRNTNDTAGSPTPGNSLAYDDGSVFTITAQVINVISLPTTELRLVSYKGTAIASDKNYNATFTAATSGGNVSAKFCNALGGVYTRTGNTITAPTLISTAMACSDTLLMEIESKFGAMMAAGATLTYESSNYVFTSTTGEKFAFTPTTPAPVNNTTLSIDLPSGGEEWKINTKQKVKITTTNVPTGAVVTVALSNGGSLGMFTSIPSTGILEFDIPERIIIGDVGTKLEAGNYSVVVTIYDKAPCGGICAPTANGAKVLATKTSLPVKIKKNNDPYFTILTPVQTFEYASTSPDIEVSWKAGNLPGEIKHYEVQLHNKMLPGQYVVINDDVSHKDSKVSFKITEKMLSKLVTTRSGKTREEVKSSYFIKVFAISKMAYFTRAVAETSTNTFTVSSVVSN